MFGNYYSRKLWKHEEHKTRKILIKISLSVLFSATKKVNGDFIPV